MEELSEHARRMVDAAPPLTPAQARQIMVLLARGEERAGQEKARAKKPRAKKQTAQPALERPLTLDAVVEEI